MATSATDLPPHPQRRELIDFAGYGLGKSGWVVFEYGPKTTADMDQLRDWVMESFCAVAPKKLAALVMELRSGPTEEE